MELDFQTGALLLLIAAVVAMLTRRLRLPYSVGLVAAGIILAILPFAPKVALTKDLIFIALLPPLLFEAAFYIHWNQLRRDFSVIFVLATLGVLLSACATATVGKPNPARHSLITTTVSRLVLRGRAPTGPAATQPGGPPNENILSLQSKRCIGRIIATKRAGFLFFAFEPPASWPRSIVSTSATAEGPGQSRMLTAKASALIVE